MRRLRQAGLSHWNEPRSVSTLHRPVNNNIVDGSGSGTDERRVADIAANELLTAADYYVDSLPGLGKLATHPT